MQRYNILCSSASANSKPILTVIQPIQQQRKLVQMEVIQRNILLYLGTRRQPYCWTELSSVCPCLCLGSSPLPASAQCNAALSKMSVGRHTSTTAQLCTALTSHSLLATGTLAELSYRSASQFHPHWQSTQPTGGAGRARQKPNVVC